jgi:hypothetical protein
MMDNKMMTDICFYVEILSDSRNTSIGVHNQKLSYVYKILHLNELFSIIIS